MVFVCYHSISLSSTSQLSTPSSLQPTPLAKFPLIECMWHPERKLQSPLHFYLLITLLCLWVITMCVLLIVLKYHISLMYVPPQPLIRVMKGIMCGNCCLRLEPMDICCDGFAQSIARQQPGKHIPTRTSGQQYGRSVFYVVHATQQ
jgi:hypothetical protein